MAKHNGMPAERNYHYEQLLCQAIRQHRVVRLQYENDLHFRTFHPYIVYREASGHIYVGGMRIHDEAAIFKAPAPRKFEVGLIASLDVTQEVFKVDYRFNSDRDKAREIVCAIDRI